MTAIGTHHPRYACAVGVITSSPRNDAEEMPPWLREAVTRMGIWTTLQDMQRESWRENLTNVGFAVIQIV